jgi:copper chaperone CopZ
MAEFIFNVEDMHCGSCAASITKVLQQADPQAQVNVDLAAHQVKVSSARLAGQAIAARISAAGFTPVPSAG